MKTNSIKIDQVLHGYSDGHSLLQSSVDLPKESQRAILILSDMSGPSMIEGFEEYLTGYQLPGTDFYALARTWHAPEMERPGCVWTHTLLIKCTDFPRISDFMPTLKLFHRPSEQNLERSYGHTIQRDDLSDGMYNTLTDLVSLGHVTRRILFSFYSSSDCLPVVLSADRSNTYERLVLALWAQQWPSLRNSFTFCTGSLKNRTINGKSFDLQIIPTRVLRQFVRDMPNAQFVTSEEAQAASNYPDWVFTGTDDLLENNPPKLRKYLCDVGDELHENRHAYVQLVEIYNCVKAVNKNQMSIDKLVDRINKIYPNATEGKSVKIRIFGLPCDRRKRLLTKVNEAELLRILAFTRHHSIFTPEMLQISDRAQSLWRKENSITRNLIKDFTQSDINPLGEDFLIGVADIIQPNELLELAEENQNFLFVFVERKPALASCKDFWKGTLDNQKELLDHLMRSKVSEKRIIESIINAMLDAHTDGIAADAYKYFQGHSIQILLEWFDSHVSDENAHLPRGWLQVLQKDPNASLSWLSKAINPNIRTIVLIVSQLDPHSAKVKDFGTEIWLKLLNNINDDLDYKNRRTLAEFLLPFSLNKPDSNYDKLAQFSFEIIHDALARDELSYDSWRRLEPVLPKLPWYTWDKCERLRRGLKRMGIDIKNI